MSIYLREFGMNGRDATLRTIEDLYNGESLRHYKRRWIPEHKWEQYDWRQKYVSNGYFSNIINTSLDFIIPMTEITNFKGRLTAAKKLK